MRVLLISGHCYPHGVATIMRILARGLIARGHSVHVYFYRDGSARSSFEQTCPSHFGPGVSLADVLVSKDFDIVHSCTSVMGLGFTRSLRFVGFRGAVLGTYHGHEVKPWLWQDERCSLSTVSEFAALKVEQTLGIRPSVVFNAVDEEVFTPEGDRIESDAPVLLWVGRSTDPEKDYPGLVSVAAIMLAKGWKVIAVDGAGASANRTSEWLGSDFTVQTALSPEQMAAMYRGVADSGGCLLMTSLCETFGLAALEAMACGCPVVAPAVGGLPELIRHGENGLLYQRDVGSEPVARIAQDLKSSSERGRMISAGKNTAHDCFSERRMVDEYERLYEKITAPRVSASVTFFHKAAAQSLLSLRRLARNLKHQHQWGRQ